MGNRKNLRILVLGYFGRYNTGDDAMLFSIIRELGKRFPGCQLRILSTSRNASFAYKWIDRSNIATHIMSVSVLLKDLYWANIVIFGGGTHFHDHRNTKRYIRNLTIYTLITTLGKLLRKKIVLMGVGIGPLTTGISRMLTRRILENADFVSVRDQYSMQWLKDLRGKKDESEKEIHRGFDLAAIVALESAVAKKILNCSPRIIGCSLLPYFAIYEKFPDLDDKLVHTIGQVLRRWLEKDSQRGVRIFIFHGPSGDDDVEISHKLANFINKPERVEIVDYCADPRETFLKVGECDAFIAMRYHSLVFAYMTGLPMIALDYHPKCSAFSQYVGLPGNAVLSLDEVLYKGLLQKRLQELMVTPSAFKSKLPLKKAIELYTLSYNQLEASVRNWFCRRFHLK